MKIVRENIDFKRGQDPRRGLDIGVIQRIKAMVDNYPGYGEFHWFIEKNPDLVRYLEEFPEMTREVIFEKLTDINYYLAGALKWIDDYYPEEIKQETFAKYIRNYTPENDFVGQIDYLVEKYNIPKGLLYSLLLGSIRDTTLNSNIFIAMKWAKEFDPSMARKIFKKARKIWDKEIEDYLNNVKVNPPQTEEIKKAEDFLESQGLLIVSNNRHRQIDSIAVIHPQAPIEFSINKGNIVYRRPISTKNYAKRNSLLFRSNGSYQEKAEELAKRIHKISKKFIDGIS